MSENLVAATLRDHFGYQTTGQLDYQQIARGVLSAFQPLDTDRRISNEETTRVAVWLDKLADTGLASPLPPPPSPKENTSDDADIITLDNIPDDDNEDTSGQ